MKEIIMQTFCTALKGKSGCLFCNPFEGMTIKETNNFRVLADTFPVTVGHVMISAKEHYGCAGEIPNELQDELIYLKKYIDSSYRKKYGKVIFYEHGRAGCCLANNPDGSKCEHFHLHALPVDIDITEDIEQIYPKIIMSNYNNIFEHYYSYGNYLFVENNNGELFFYPTGDVNVASHLLRTLICKKLDVLYRADWEQYNEQDVWVESRFEIEELLV